LFLLAIFVAVHIPKKHQFIFVFYELLITHSALFLLLCVFL